MAKGPQRLMRWMLGYEQPKPYSLDLDHPAMEDIAWAADEIQRLREQVDALRRAIRDCKDTLTEASLDLEDKVIAANLSWNGDYAPASREGTGGAE